jgi:BTB/POZ domain
MQPFHHPVIVLPQTSYSDVCALVSFMYSGEVNIYQEQLPSLLAAAAALHIRGLAEVPHAQVSFYYLFHANYFNISSPTLK